MNIDRDKLRRLAEDVERQKYEVDDDAMDALVAYVESLINDAHEVAAQICDHVADRCRSSAANARADECARRVRKLKTERVMYDHCNY